jgi:hypothetical protein
VALSAIRVGEDIAVVVVVPHDEMGAMGRSFTAAQDGSGRCPPARTSPATVGPRRVRSTVLMGRRDAREANEDDGSGLIRRAGRLDELAIDPLVVSCHS